ncbi:MAG TPA: SDR family oxidoreductase [Flavisolibacter sp.]|nr:SDR family oxidoreductase [Flavisolibacter sp.]
MQTVILFGSTGNLGKKVAEELFQKGYDVTAVVRNSKKADALKPFVHHVVIADVTNPSSLKDICRGIDIVVSTLGKSVSPANLSKPSFRDIDLNANSAILDEAVKSRVKKFVYVSAFHAEQLTHLEYFNVHHQFSERLKQAGIDYSIIKPPALFSAFLDLMDMAKKGMLVTMGPGDKQTNPIYEGDLAKFVVDSIQQPNAIIEAGGKEVLSRKAINEIIQQLIAPNKKVRTIPLGLIKALLPLMKIVSKNMYHKMAFFTVVMQEDTIAPKIGNMRLEEYIRMRQAAVVEH